MKHGRRPQAGHGTGHARTVQKIDVAAPPPNHVRAAGGEKIDKMAAGETAGACHKDRSHGVERSRTNGGHFMSRSDSVGVEIGQAMPIRGSFHMNPDSCAGAYSVVVM